MDPVVVVIACKVAFIPFANDIDRENSAYTGYKPYKWAIKHSKMHCRRLEVPVINPQAPDEAFSELRCMHASLQTRMAWDRGHANQAWRVWKTACPVPIVDTRTGKVLAWKLPEGPRINKQDRVAVHYDVDSSI